MTRVKVTLAPLNADDKEQFILDNQWAFKYGAMVEFGQRDDHIDEEGEIISRDTIMHCIEEADNEAYRIICDGKKVGGMVLKVDKETNYNYLELFFVLPSEHGKGIGYSAWQAAEAMYPETRIWETCTPYFEKRNIHFYVNKCGFHIVEFYNKFNIASHDIHAEEGQDEMFRFIKVMQ